MNENSVMDFIPEFSSYLKEHYPINDLWADLLSCTTLASVLAKDSHLETKYGKNKCNNWIAYFAPSGEFKSLPITEKITPLLTYVGNRIDRDIILPSIASTTEGLIKYFAEKNASGIIVRDELTTLFKESFYRQYLTDELEIYSKMYDGWIPPTCNDAL